MRTFKLINAIGESYDVTERYNAFMHTVANLGMQIETEYQRIGGHFALLSYYAQQGVIKGTVKFWDQLEYFNFARFCQKRPLELQYTVGTNTYRRKGVVTKISKDESNPLQSDIDFSCTTPFYRFISKFNAAEDVGGGKEYSYTYPYTYSDNVAQSITISSDTINDSPCMITIHGPVVNPTWRHYVNNTLKATGRVIGTIEASRKLVIDTTSIPYKIHKEDMSGNFIADMYQQSDFSTERFITLQYGQNTISVSGESAARIPIGVEAMIEYDTV